jgi:hypothetical protein
VTGRVFAQAREEVRVGVGHALRGTEYAFAVGVVADGDEDLAHRPLDAGSVYFVLPRDLLGQLLPLPQTGQPADYDLSKYKHLEDHGPGGGFLS